MSTRDGAYPMSCSTAAASRSGACTPTTGANRLAQAATPRECLHLRGTVPANSHSARACAHATSVVATTATYGEYGGFAYRPWPPLCPPYQRCCRPSPAHCEEAVLSGGSGDDDTDDELPPSGLVPPRCAQLCFGDEQGPPLRRLGPVAMTGPGTRPTVLFVTGLLAMCEQSARFTLRLRKGRTGERLPCECAHPRRLGTGWPPYRGTAWYGGYHGASIPVFTGSTVGVWPFEPSRLGPSLHARGEYCAIRLPKIGPNASVLVCLTSALLIGAVRLQILPPPEALLDLAHRDESLSLLKQSWTRTVRWARGSLRPASARPA